MRRQRRPSVARRRVARLLVFGCGALLVGTSAGARAIRTGSPNAGTESQHSQEAGAWLLRGARLWSDDLGFQDGGEVLIRDGVIEAVGPDLNPPDDAVVVEAQGGTILPGLIEAHTQTGLHGDGISWDTDENLVSIAANLHALDGYYPFAADVASARRAGITTMLVSPGGKNLVGGTAVLLKPALSKSSRFVVRQPAALKLSLGEEPKRDSASPKTRMGEMAMLREHLRAAAAYEARRTAGSGDSEAEPEADPELDATAAMLRGEIPALFQAYRAVDIMNALRLSDEFGFEAILAYATEAHLVADELVRREVPVILTSMKGLWYRLERETFTRRNAPLLIDAGVRIALQQGEGNPYGNGDLLFNAAYLLGSGVDEEDALRALTSWPAGILDVSDRLGHLRPGLDADVVMLSGDPFNARSRVLHVFINGAPVCEHS